MSGDLIDFSATEICVQNGAGLSDSRNLASEAAGGSNGNLGDSSGMRTDRCVPLQPTPAPFISSPTLLESFDPVAVLKELDSEANAAHKIAKDSPNSESSGQVDFGKLAIAQESQGVAQKSYGQKSKKKERQVKTLSLRSYQEELAKPANKRPSGARGKNTIIVAPTGSGKTFVAVDIIMKHLQDSDSSDIRRRKVAFLVPTVPLVGQQAGVMRDFMGDKRTICEISGGDTEVPKGDAVRESDIVVVTPQCLLNMVQNPDKQDRVEIYHFSLFVFDECHHCNSKHPYRDGEKLPQVVGLSASLGVGGAETVDNARIHIITLGAHLDAEFLSTVRNCQEDLDKHVHVPTDELQQVQFSQPGQPFAIHICDEMLGIEEKVYVDVDKLRKMKSPIVEGLKARPLEGHKTGRARYLEPYASWVNSLLSSKAGVIQDRDMSRRLMSNLQYLKIYQQALDFHAHLPGKMALEYLCDKMSAYDTRVPQMTEEERDLYDGWRMLKATLVKQDECRNNLVEKLISILQEQFSREPDSRAIVFVKTRDLTQGLVGTLLETSLAKQRPQYLTSVNVGIERGGMTKPEQDVVLERFRSGAVRILVATTVAEEGLDIEKCNLVIKYNHVTGEIPMVQKRGRGRAEGSRSVLLTQSGVVADREMENMKKNKIMLAAIALINEEGMRSFRKTVEKTQEYEYTNRRLDDRMVTERRREFGDRKYMLHCKACSAIICRSDEVKKVMNSHYAVINPEIWRRVHVDVHEKSKALYQVTVAGRLTCRECATRDYLGNAIKYRNTILPTLKAHALKLISIENSAVTKIEGKWIKIEEKFFVVENIKVADLETMHRCLKEHVEMAKEMEAEVARVEARRRRNEDDDSFGEDED